MWFRKRVYVSASVCDCVGVMNTETTTTASHTPGPWVAQCLDTNHNGYDWPTFTVRSNPGNHCLAVVGDVDRATAHQNEANARLIAAAPDLLECLKQAVDSLEYWFPRWGDPDGANSQMMQNARAAIAKATQANA